ncbi:MAG: PD-(D/E)XK nuclease family protein [Bacteroidales bacterium]|nr:PD-(D/E)XK nuclease family protein [Candidatus Cacconaster merdequi]
MRFLEEVASLFALRDDISDLCFVFPNRRSSIFFQRYLGISAGRPIFSPRLLTINELFGELSPDLRPIDKIAALGVLYDIYVKLMPRREGEQPESLDSFLFWGDILLGDFDDIDKYMVPADKLLRNVKDLRDLSVSYDFLSPTQREAVAEFCRNFNPDVPHSMAADDKKRLFSQTWDILLPLYEEFRLRLRERGEGYEGMIYRDVAENMNLSALKQKYKEVVFVGLNALNECEKALLTAIGREGFGDFYWDFTGRMVTDPDNKAGLFIRENIRKYPSKHALSPVPDDFRQRFEVISCPSAVGQTRIAGRIIEDLAGSEDESDLVGTAVVLPDEGLLFPMLNAIPKCVEKVNVTMGYSLSASNVSGFFNLLERLQNNVREKKGRNCFYHRDVTELLEHPYFNNPLCGDGKGDGLKRSIVDANRIFVDEEVLSSVSELYRTVFRCIERTEDMPQYLTDVIDIVQQGQSDVDREFLYNFRKAVTSLSAIDIDFMKMERRTYFRLLSKYIALISIPYNGEPLGGLQIMGPLETRALDFDNVIMLSVSEGVFPSKSVSASFIPYNLRIGFGMPTYEYQDALAAYYFYRSICRAKNVFLIYDSRTEGLQSGEESRYIKQLKYHYEVPLIEQSVSYSLSSENVVFSERMVEKSPAVMKELTDLFVDGKGVLSASSLNTYIDCPLHFYYRYVKGLEEEKEVVEELDAGLFGTIFHKAMHLIYEPFTGRQVSKDEIILLRKRKSEIERLVSESFREDAGIEEVTGRNLILRDVIVKYIDRTLETDAATAPFVLVGTEKIASARYVPSTLGRSIRLFGFIDRLDTQDSTVVRVVDYKTGSVKGKDDCCNVDNIFDLPQDKRPGVAFQLYFYALLLTDGNDFPGFSGYDQCIYPLRTIFDGVPESHTIEKEKLDLYRKRLHPLVDEIFDPDRPFVGRSTNGKVCEYCEFKKLCGR